MPSEPLPKGRIIARGPLRRCPHCGQGGPFRRWVSMTADRPHCGHRFEREQGYWVRAVVVNTAVTFGLFIAIGVPIIALTWPVVPWGVILIVTLVFNGLFPILFYPLSKTIWVAPDLAARPLEPAEVAAAAERVAAGAT
ncbi:MAG: DUF983 domain-containing protein [Acidimicrobiia bacterium]|nr:DUF983 domain-containing protein [Acidimicrobiia bacterium]